MPISFNVNNNLNDKNIKITIDNNDNKDIERNITSKENNIDNIKSVSSKNETFAAPLPI